MSRVMQGILLASTMLCIFTLGAMFAGPAANTPAFADGNPEGWQFPQASVPRDGRTPDLGGIALNPFQPKMFEGLQLKGFAKNRTGWSGIFLGPNGSTMVLPTGGTREGITLIEADGKTAKIRFGSMLRELSLPAAQSISGTRNP